MLSRFFRRCLGLLLAAALVVGGGILLAGYRDYRAAVDAAPLTEQVAAVQAREGYTPTPQLPALFLDAVVAVEDQHFYRHCGVRPAAIVRALLVNLQAREVVEGGSTITQQLAKNLYFTHQPSLLRKVAELFLAFDLERQYSKQEILELYVNTIYYGDGYSGIGPAAEGYFGLAPGEMNDDQCTLLAGVPNAPSAYALREHLQLARQRQTTVLDRMEAAGCLTAARRGQIMALQGETNALLGY